MQVGTDLCASAVVTSVLPLYWHRQYNGRWYIAGVCASACPAAGFCAVHLTVCLVWYATCVFIVQALHAIVPRSYAYQCRPLFCDAYPLQQ